MTNKNKLIGVVLVIVGLVVGALLASSFGAKKDVGGVYSLSEQSFGEGIAVGTTRQFVISRLGVITSSASQALSGAVALTSTFKVGSAGTAINRWNRGICFVKPYATTIAASSTATVDCQATAATGSITGPTSALAGVAFGDVVNTTLSTTTASGGGVTGSTVTGMGLAIQGASASTTQGYITLIVANQTGGTYTWPLTGIATGTVSYTAGN